MQTPALPAPNTMQVQIKFTRSGASQAFGGFAPGDILRCSAAAARHFVDDVACAVYVTTKAPAQVTNSNSPGQVRKRQHRKDDQS